MQIANMPMDKQMSLSDLNDELAQVRTKKKRISCTDRAHHSVGSREEHLAF